MSHKLVLLKSFPKIVGWSALLVWFSFIYLFLQYDATRPTTPQPLQGRIYSSNNHGHVTYLTEREESNLHSLQVAAFGLFVAAGLMDYFQRNPKQIGEVRIMALRTLYELFSPASWLAFGARVRGRFASFRIRSAIAVLAGQKRIRLHSSNAVSDCRTRLAGSIGFNTVGPVLGSTRGDKFHLHVVRKDFRNSFAPQFYGKLIATTSGTIIDGRFSMHFIVRIFLIIWFTGVIAIGGRIAVFSFKTLVAGRVTENTYIGLFFPALLFLCGVLMVYWGKVIGTDDETQIVAFLRNTLNAQAQA